MKNQILISVFTLISLFCSFLYAQQDSLNFPAPQYMLPIYDHYSVNHLNVEAMGRGLTLNAATGKVENAVHNPASLISDKSYLYMELVIKPPIREINKDNDMTYTSPIPIGIFGISGHLYRGLYGAISYNVPKAIVYDDFTVNIGQNADAVTRYPSYHLHQITATIAKEVNNLKLGLNLHQQLHQFKDIIVYQTFDRVDKTYYIVRMQPGLQYQWKNIVIATSVTPPTETEMDIRYEVYDVTLPLKVSGGIKAEFDNNTIYADMDWEQFSIMDKEFKDRLILKGGFEKRIRNFTYRAGLMSFPGVYKGYYKLPVLETSNIEQLQWWSAVPRGGRIANTDQLYLTAGYTYHFGGGKLVMGVMRDILDNVPVTQFSMAVGFNLETLKGKKFLIFDK